MLFNRPVNGIELKTLDTVILKEVDRKVGCAKSVLIVSLLFKLQTLFHAFKCIGYVGLSHIFMDQSSLSKYFYGLIGTQQVFLWINQHLVGTFMDKSVLNRYLNLKKAYKWKGKGDRTLLQAYRWASLPLGYSHVCSTLDLPGYLYTLMSSPWKTEVGFFFFGWHHILCNTPE